MASTEGSPASSAAGVCLFRAFSKCELQIYLPTFSQASGAQRTQLRELPVRRVLVQVKNLVLAMATRYSIRSCFRCTTVSAAFGNGCHCISKVQYAEHLSICAAKFYPYDHMFRWLSYGQGMFYILGSLPERLLLNQGARGI